MRRIAHGEIGRHRKRFDARLVFDDGVRDGGLVERRRLFAGRDMAALHSNHDAAASMTQQTRSLDHRLIKADHQRTYGTEAVFDDGVGGQRGRHGHETDIFAARAGRKQAKDPAGRFADAETKIPRRCQRLGGRNDPFAIAQQHCIRECAAGVEAEPKTLCLRVLVVQRRICGAHKSASEYHARGSIESGWQMQKAVRKYLKALEAGDADKADALLVADGWVQSPFLGKIPVREYVRKVADASSSTALTVHDVLVSAEGHMRAVAYYLYDWQLKDGSKVSFECADVFNFDLNTGRIASIVLVYDTHLVRGAVENKYP